MVTAAIASAPLVTLSMPVPAPKYYGLRIMASITPSVTIHAGIDAAGISHDKEEIQKYLDDPLVHDFATLATCKYLLYIIQCILTCMVVRSFIDAGSDILKTRAKSIKTTILYSHADTDPINAYKSTSEAFDLTSSETKELKDWPGLFHECK